MWQGVNLEKALANARRQDQKREQDQVLEAYRMLLQKEDEVDDEILNNIIGGGGEQAQLRYDLLDPERIFHRDQIKKICTQYRLRFLDGRYFRGEIPYEAISKIKALQRNQGAEISSFKIMAPAPVFNLQERDKDPLLFIPLSADRFYLVHKWGNDLNPVRKFLVLPFRNFKTLLASVAALAFMVMMLAPDSLYLGSYAQSSIVPRVIFFFYLFIGFGGLTALYGFSRMRNFNSSLWDSRYLD